MKSSSDFTVLVVDDEEILKDTIAFEIRRKKFNVVTADDGAQALQILKSQHIDFVLTDIRMPGVDGIQLLDEIHKMTSHKPFVYVMTGYSEYTEAEYYKRGAMGVLHKPFDRAVLIQALSQALNVQI